MDNLGCVLDETMLGETMALRVIEKSTLGWCFVIEKIGFSDALLQRPLCIALIQPHFDCCLYCVVLKLAAERYSASCTKQMH